MTKELLKTFKKVTTIEKDVSLKEILEKSFKDDTKLELIFNDILKEKEPAGTYVVVANIPYYITGAIIKKFLSSKNPPKKITLLVQKK